MSTDRPVRFGIIGAGRVARDFAQGIGAVEGATLAAVTSRTDATAQSFVQMFPSAAIHPTPLDLARDESLDVVYVATPHHLHAEHATLCLENGRAVVCEKPFTVDAAQARRVVELARQRELFCMEAMWMRFFPAVRALAEMLTNRAIGDPRLLTADFGFPHMVDPSSRFFDPEQGGGALLDRGVYGISLATMLFGAPVAVESLSGSASTGVDEHSGVLLRFEHERVAVILSSLTSWTSNEATVTGTEGKITLAAPFYCSGGLALRRYSPSSNSPVLSGEQSTKQRVVSTLKQSAVGRRAIDLIRPFAQRPSRTRFPIAGNGYTYEVEEVVRCLRAGLKESPVMPLDESVAVMEILDRARACWTR